jgi:two-component system phosphate regulon sensor histidine kinase PhoR
MEKFIFRKLKLIYKTIHDYKLSTNSKIKNIDSNIELFQNVEQDVKDWAENKNNEISELKSLESYRKEFVGNVTHELRTPIFTIQGFIHTLLDGGLYDDNINKNYLKKAAKNVDRLLNIVNDLETISNLESSVKSLELSEFDLKPLVEDVFDDLQISAKSKKIGLQFKKGANTGFIVKADKEKIRQVLVNLINNSIKYGKEGGVTKVSFYGMDKFVLIEVSDNGIGIDSNDLKHLFDRFYRTDKSRSRQAGGSGLGLSIVKHIIEAHNQTINVRSTPDLGSTFGFTLEKV